MQQPVFDREREKAELDRAWRSGKPELLIAAGRRRAGKSYLLTRYLQGKDGLYYQVAKATSREQLRALSQIAAAQFQQAGVGFAGGFPDWESFFRSLPSHIAMPRSSSATIPRATGSWPMRLSEVSPASSH
jgi:AAA+ ATPase superfamily predicted ATPase